MCRQVGPAAWDFLGCLWIGYDCTPSAWEGGSLAGAASVFSSLLGWFCDSVGLSCCGVCGRSGETGTVVFQLGAVAVKQMCSAGAPQKFSLLLFFLICFLSALCFWASSQHIPTPLLAAPRKACFPSPQFRIGINAAKFWRMVKESGCINRCVSTKCIDRRRSS